MENNQEPLIFINLGLKHLLPHSAVWHVLIRAPGPLMPCPPGMSLAQVCDFQCSACHLLFPSVLSITFSLKKKYTWGIRVEGKKENGIYSVRRVRNLHHSLPKKGRDIIWKMPQNRVESDVWHDATHSHSRRVKKQCLVSCLWRLLLMPKIFFSAIFRLGRDSWRYI